MLAGAAQVGLVAINDGIVLESCIYRVLQRHFRDQPYYAQLLELFHEVSPRPLAATRLTLWHARRRPSPSPPSGMCCGADAMPMPVSWTGCARNMSSMAYTREFCRKAAH